MSASLAPGAATVAGGAVAKKGGTLRLSVSDTDIQSPDPALDYENVGAQLLAATCAKLVNYPDRPAPAGSQLEPEVAVGLPVVTNGGRTYTFRLRSTYRFSDGSPVTAASFERAIERVVAGKTGSPGVGFASDIVGADAYNRGKATNIKGVVAKGNRLAVTLVGPAPDLVARLAMNFFCAVPASTPIDPKGLIVPMAGPYYIASQTPGREIVLKRNPYYRGGRPANVDEIVATVNQPAQASYLNVQSGAADYDPTGVPAQASQELARKYGVNKGRYFVHPSLTISYFAMNTTRSPFDEVKVRQAVNFALNRPAITAQSGVLAGTPTDQILPPGLRGFRDAKIYPIQQPDIAKAKALMGGKTAKVALYTTSSASASQQALVVQQNLKAIGLDVTVQRYAFGVLISKIGVPTEPYDIAAFQWYADYPDPYDFINVLLDGSRITRQNNINTAQFNDPTYNKRMHQASVLGGPKRYLSYGGLDIDITRNAAPLAVTSVSNTREFVSSRVGCYVYQPAYVGMSLAAACLK